MKRVAVESEAVRALGYDPQRRELDVEFHDQRVYRYRQVPPEAVLALLEAESLGRHFAQVFKPAGYAYRRIDRGQEGNGLN